MHGRAELNEGDELRRENVSLKQLLETCAAERDVANINLRAALEREAATSEILRVISRSTFGLKSVLQTLVDSAVRLCAQDGVIYLRDGDVFRAQAAFGADVAGSDPRNRSPRRAGRDSVTGRVALSGRVEQIPDNEADPDFQVPPAQRMKMRALLGVPLLSDGKVEGVFVLAKPEPGLFSERAVEVVRTFADQAVIAIQNARLFDEVQSKTRDLEVALAQQTATADVLKAISRSAFDLDGVLKTLVESARDLCHASIASINVVDDGLLQFRALAGGPPEFEAFLRANPFPLAAPTRANNAGRVLLAKAASYVEDVANEPDYAFGEAPRLGGFRSLLGVPLMRDGEVIGVFQIGAPEPGALSPRQIDLVAVFADQAVIAIENARLIEEVRARTRDLEEALEQQTATADVLKVISRSVFDLDAVLKTLIDTAVRLARGSRGTIFIRDGDLLRARAFHSQVPPSLKDYLTANPIPIDDEEPSGRAMREGRLIHVPDMSVYDTERIRQTRRRAGFGAALWVPLLRGGEAIGLFGVPREEAVAFSEREIELVRTFADQAVIAIENARLFEEVQARTRELERSLSDLRKAQDRLVQSEKLASLGQLTAGIAHEIKNPLNFVNNFASLSRELMQELREMLKALPEDAAVDAFDLMGMIDSNLEKVASHGKRADSIVKNMLLHSREGSGERTNVNVNAMVEEAINLAYHGARAEKLGFNVTLERELDPQAGEAEVHAQEITRVLLNLISNGFYACARRQDVEGPDYAPTLRATTRDLGEDVELRIRDNGTGIPDEVRARMFNPFFTTKPAGEGTGLGLSLSHDIVVKQHGGTIDVESEPGAYAEFIVTLPRKGGGA